MYLKFKNLEILLTSTWAATYYKLRCQN